MSELLKNYRKEMQQELENILSYWTNYSVDLRNGGFYGKVDNSNKVQEDAPKGSVLNSRILWTFSAAYNLTKKPGYLQTAERAFKYISSYFIDRTFGGIYWTVDYRGNPANTNKQMYALSFAIYGLSEYYKASEEERAKELAIDLYKTIIKHSYDKVHGGYFEALTRDWKEINDLRPGAKVSNEKKSMHTQLHILEGFANLYLVWPDATLKGHIEELIYIFLDHIIDQETKHLVLFLIKNGTKDQIRYPTAMTSQLRGWCRKRLK